MFETVVLALDGSEQSDKALALATELVREHGSTLHVVHVAEVALARGGGMLRLDEDELRAKIRDQLDGLAEAGIDAGIELRSAVAGRCANVIADVAAGLDADVILVGSRGHAPLAGMLLGSVTQRLLHLAPCPMLVVPGTSALPETAQPGRLAIAAS
jgi:nucleotide-binding universal stress UspA family protein